MSNTRSVGSRYEKLAAAYLRKQGLKLLSSNYLCRLGEIDLIMNHGNCIVFVEVRFREAEGFGSAVHTITTAKQQKIIRTAKLYLCEQGLYDKVDCRFDVTGITLRQGNAEIEWIQNAFS